MQTVLREEDLLKNKKSKQTVLPGGFRSWTKDEFLNDETVRRIDFKLRQSNNLAGYDLISVSSQVVAGTNYALTYGNNQGSTWIFNVFVSLSGDITVKSGNLTPNKPV